MATVITTPWTNAKFLAGGSRLAAAYLQQKVLGILADRVTIRRFLPFVGDPSGSGSDTWRQLYSQLGPGIPMESVAEAGTLTAIGITVDYRDITLGRHGLEAHESFLGQITGRPGLDMDLDMLAASLLDTYEAEFMDSVATIVATAATSVGTSGSDMVMDDLYDATYFFDLQDGFEGDLIGVVHGRQIADLKESKRGEPADWVKAEDQVAFKAPGFQGQILGANMFKSNRITSDGTNRLGAVFGPRAIAYTAARAGIQRVKGLSSNAILLNEPGIILDWDSDSNGALSKFFANAWYGLAIGDQGQKEICGVATDA